MSATLREASERDLDELLRLDAACFAVPWTSASWQAELAGPSGDPQGRRLVLLAGQPAIGFACATIVIDVCELRRIGVSPSARGRGLGRDLLLGVIAHARARACERVELEVASRNVAALGLYRAAGFAELGRRPRYYRDPPDDAVLMTLAL
ncbi:MAG TPA: ribosomal protein S18-alanine N-acetyltransferase [Enhygromyxa sp.]|nr:ribosomal protein S18-alanine N-acetyltransferase [Enhygromyxa sp.]